MLCLQCYAGLLVANVIIKLVGFNGIVDMPWWQVLLAPALTSLWLFGLLYVYSYLSNPPAGDREEQ